MKNEIIFQSCGAKAMATELVETMARNIFGPIDERTLTKVRQNVMPFLDQAHQRGLERGRESERAEIVAMIERDFDAPHVIGISCAIINTIQSSAHKGAGEC